MTGVIAHPGEFLDEQSDARQGPQLSLVTLNFWAREQRRGDLLSLRRAEFGFAARRSLAGQGRDPALRPRVLPTVGDLPGDAQQARDFRGRSVLLEKLGRFAATFFQLGMVSGLRHAQTIQQNTIDVTLLYETQ